MIGILNAVQELGMYVIYNIRETIACFIYFQLPVSTSAFFKHFMNMTYRVPASEWGYYVINKIKEFINEYPGIYFSFFSKIDHTAVYTIPAGTPFIFVDQDTRINNKIQIL